MPDEQRQWVIRDVDEETRRKVKAFAANNGLSIGEALKMLVDVALSNAVNIVVTPESTEMARRLQLSPEFVEAIQEEVRRQIRKQE